MARQVEYLDELHIAIRYKHLCNATHRESVFVHEKNEKGETAWKGYVEVFDLTGHPETKTCYAWLNHKTNGINILTVLGNHLIDSAPKAIQAAIFTDAQIAFRSDLSVLNEQVQREKKALLETKIKSENLDAAIQAARDLKEIIKKTRSES